MSTDKENKISMKPNEKRDMLKRIQLSEEEIRGHYDWLKKMTAKFYLPHLNAVPYIERALLIAKNQKSR